MLRQKEILENEKCIGRMPCHRVVLRVIKEECIFWSSIRTKVPFNRRDSVIPKQNLTGGVEEFAKNKLHNRRSSTIPSSVLLCKLQQLELKEEEKTKMECEGIRNLETKTIEKAVKRRRRHSSVTSAA